MHSNIELLFWPWDNFSFQSTKYYCCLLKTVIDFSQLFKAHVITFHTVFLAYTSRTHNKDNAFFLP